MLHLEDRGLGKCTKLERWRIAVAEVILDQMSIDKIKAELRYLLAEEEAYQAGDRGRQDSRYGAKDFTTSIRTLALKPFLLDTASGARPQRGSRG